MFGSKQLRPGDLVRVRTAREILATLDEQGTVDGIPFMPEMIRHLDRHYRVSKRIEKICWYTPESSFRRLPGTLFLEDMRCDGSAHGGCQAECRIYWREAWVERIEPGTPGQSSDDASLDELRAYVEARTRTTKAFDTGPEEVFQCQITESLGASTPIKPHEWGQNIAELRNGNVGIVRFLRVFGRMIAWRIAHRLGRYPDLPKVGGPDRVDGEKLGLVAGELVEVRSLDEIGATLDENLKHRGLGYSEELTPACGKRFRVKNRVDRLIDEKTGRMIELKNDCIVLDGFVCSGDRSAGGLFCPREAYPLFREAWLRRVQERDAAAHDAMAEPLPRDAAQPAAAASQANDQA